MTEFLEAGTISILIGLFVGVLEEFVLVKFFRKKSFLTVSLIRAFIYSLLTSIVLEPCTELVVMSNNMDCIPA